MKTQPFEFIEILHPVSPYKNFDVRGFRCDLQGWNSERTVFKDLIDQVSPQLIIEVGTWKGASAIFMGKYLCAKKMVCKILCVDTWLGSLDVWESKDSVKRAAFLKLKNGHPAIYGQFLFNVIYHQLTDVIIPFPQTSSIAARWLKRKNVLADLIYIDGSHEEADMDDDLENYFGLLKTGGILFGDDYCDETAGVKCAVERFARANQKVIEIKDEQFWVMQK